MKSIKNNKLHFERKSLKGQEMPEAIGMTLILLLVLVGLIMIGFLVYLKITYNIISGDQISYSVEFVSIANKPFMLAEVLTHMNVSDRQILEHAVESVATGSVERANSEELDDGIKFIIGPYSFDYYRFGLEMGENSLLESDNIETKCGENDIGWCAGRLVGCDVGYVPVDPKGKCGSVAISMLAVPPKVCCALNTNEYRQKGNSRGKYDVITCDNNRGVCSEGEKFLLYTPTKCGEGQTTLGTPDECRNINNGKTPFCCAEKTDELEVETGVTTQAVIPILYKDREGRIEVEVR